MLDQVDKRLSEWARSLLDGAEVSLDAPHAKRDGRGVGLYLLDVVPDPVGRGQRRPPLQIAARYLVSTWADDPSAAHQDLGTLMFAALERADLRVEATGPEPALWSALGSQPRPAFVIRVPVRLEREQPDTKIVLKPMVMESIPIAPLHGVVLTPDDLPVPGARIELTDLDLATLTDVDGRFFFPSVPSGSEGNAISVAAKGTKRLYVSNSHEKEESLLIRFDPREG